MYISALFKKSKRYAKKYYDDYYILSAKYGLLNKNKCIDPYNMTLNTMSKDHKIKWSIYVAKQIKKEIPDAELFFLAGNNYYNDLIKYISNKKTIVMQGLSIGKRLQYLNKNL